MTSRERIVLALNHREADRIPIDFGGQHTSVHHVGHQRLKEYLGLTGGPEPVVTDRFQMIVDPDPRLKERFGSDVISFFSNPGTGWELQVDPVTDRWTDEWGITYQRPPDGFWYDFADHPLKEGTREELEAYHWPDPYDPNRIAGLEEKARHWYENTDKALLIHNCTGGMYEHSYFLRGLEELYIDMLTNIAYAEALAEKVLEFQIGFWDNVLSAVGKYVQVVQIGDDLGSQDGALFSPEIYRKLYKGRHRRLIDFIHTKTDAKVYFHSCGSIHGILPDIIESGVQVLNPVQVSAKNMDSAILKREFGKDLVFWGGGADATRIMTFASPEGVKEEVKRRIHDLAPGGGFVFASVHNIQANVPPQNIVAFFEAAHEYGQYPITGLQTLESLVGTSGL